MSWWATILLWKCKAVSNILFFVFPILWNILESSYNVKFLFLFFCWHHFLWDTAILFVMNHLCHLYQFISPSQILCGCVSSVSQTASESHFHGQLSLLYINLHLNFNSSVIIFCFFAIVLSLLTSSLFRLSIFVKCHMELLLRDQQVTQLYSFLSMCELSKW